MRKILTIMVVALLAFTFACGNNTEMEQDAAQKIRKATVTYALGDAYILRENDPGKTAIKLNMQLQPNDMVVTGSGGNVKIVIEDQGVIQISQNSKVVMSSLLLNEDGSADQKLMVKAGKVVLGLKKLQKNSTFDVETPTAVAGVRGTSFMVSVEEEENNAFPFFVKVNPEKNLTTKVAVLAGSVELGNDDSQKTHMINPLKMAILEGSDFANVRIVDIERLYLNALQEIKGFAEIQKLKMDEITEEISSIEPQIRAVHKKLNTTSEIKKATTIDLEAQEKKLQDDIEAQEKEIESVKTKQKREGKYLEDGAAW